MPGFGGFGGSGFGGSPFGARAAPSKPEPHVTQVPVSLEDLYTGFSKKLAVTRKRPTPDGRGVRDDKTVLIIDGQKGWKSGTKVTFENEGDQFPGTEAGDLTFVITEKPHMRFKRDGIPRQVAPVGDISSTLHRQYVDISCCDLASRRPLRSEH